MTGTETRRRLRWPRYTVRTLGIGIAVLCVWLGTLANKVHRQRLAIAALHNSRSNAGLLRFDDGSFLYIADLGRERVDGNLGATNSGPQWLRHCLGNEWFRQPLELDLFDSNVTDETIAACVDGMPKLRSLSISSLSVTDQAMSDIATLEKLESLMLNCPLLTPSGMAKLRPLKSLRKFVSIKVRRDDSVDQLLFHSADQLGPRPMSLILALESLSENCGGNIQIDPEIAQALRPLLPGTGQVTGRSLNAALAAAFRLHDIDYYVKDRVCYVANATDAAAGRAGFKIVNAMFPDLTKLQMDW